MDWMPVKCSRLWLRLETGGFSCIIARAPHMGELFTRLADAAAIAAIIVFRRAISELKFRSAHLCQINHCKCILFLTHLHASLLSSAAPRSVRSIRSCLFARYILSMMCFVSVFLVFAFNLELFSQFFPLPSSFVPIHWHTSIIRANRSLY